MARAKQAEMVMHFTLPTDEDSQSFIDLAQCYSLINRLFCRQGMQIAIAGMSVSGGLDSKVSVARLPESWPCINAWEKSYHVWRESQDQVLDLEPSIGGRYRDFKVFFNADHQAAGVSANLIPQQFSTTFGGTDRYEWDMSEIQIPNDPVPDTTTGYNFHVLGPSTPVSKGLITGYAASRARPQQIEPNLVGTASTEDWMRDSFDVGSDLDEIREDLELENRTPPYVVGEAGSALSFYPGGQVQGGAVTEAIMFTRAGKGTQTFAGGFTAPAGLLRVTCVGDGAVDGRLIVRLMPGAYKGLMARPMVDVN